eukprot:COSAG06_NODE_32166_length_510_cov_0.871046_1_plen_96_part_10
MWLRVASFGLTAAANEEQRAKSCSYHDQLLQVFFLRHRTVVGICTKIALVWLVAHPIIHGKARRVTTVDSIHAALAGVRLITVPIIGESALIGEDR